jgi:2'-5' RNA ligase
VRERDRLRLFVAAEIPEGFRAARWVRPEGIHLTFKFLGATEASRLEDVGEAIAGVCAGVARFDLLTGLPGFFGSLNRPRVLWSAVEGDVGAAESLAARLEGAMERLDYERESRAFRPHLTLARFGAGRGSSIPEGLLERAAERLAGIAFPVEALVLFESRLSPKGAQHVARRSFPLEPREP